MVHPRNDMAAHLEDEDRQRQARGNGQVARQDAAFFFLMGFDLGIGSSAPVDGARGIANFCDSGD